MVLTAQGARWLRDHNYGTDVFDHCWLDCAREEGYLKTYRGRMICLCWVHAVMLEAGKAGGTYRGAPLPPESIATEWPWQPLQPVSVPVSA